MVGRRRGCHILHDNLLVTYVVRLISVTTGTLADPIWPHPQPQGNILLVLTNNKTVTVA